MINMTCKCGQTTVQFKNLAEKDFPNGWTTDCCEAKPAKKSRQEPTPTPTPAPEPESQPEEAPTPEAESTSEAAPAEEPAPEPAPKASWERKQRGRKPK